MKKISMIIVLLFLSACMGGNMKGVTSDGKPITMKYSQGYSSDTYSTVIDGETFEGTAVMVEDSTTFGSAFGAAYSSYGSAFANSLGAAYSSTGKAKAVLIGSKGSSLRCIMEYADNSGFTTAGGIGNCVHSDGRTLVVQW